VLPAGVLCDLFTPEGLQVDVCIVANQLYEMREESLTFQPSLSREAFVVDMSTPTVAGSSIKDRQKP
jgi:hypothetical protein